MPFQFDDVPTGRFQFDDAPKADPQIGKPQELTFGEKYVGPLIDAAWRGITGQPGLDQIAGGNIRGSAVGGAMQGAAAPGIKMVQLAANALPGSAGQSVNQAVQGEEQQYQDDRKAAGRDGWDVARAFGNAAITAPVGALGGAPSTLLGLIGKGALQGGVTGALQPITDGGENFWKETAKDTGIGAITGGVVSGGIGSLARVVSPNASVNSDVQMLRDAGIKPTIGQTLGGWANTLEEKAQSLPILGDAISAARRRSMEDFNKAVLDTAEAPVGGKAIGSGFDAVSHAGDTLRSAYNKAASDVGQVNLNGQAFNDGLQQVMDKAAGLPQPMQEQFKKILNEEVLRRMKPDGSVVGDNIKVIDSALGKAAADWNRYTNPQTERELGGVLRQLQQAFRDGLAEASPSYDAARQSADQGWRVFRLARDAAAAAKNREGVFTPAQLNSAIQSNSGKAAMGEGRAFMQDASTAAQNVLGNKYPDSGTVGRLLINGLAIPGHIASGGTTAAGLGGAALAYTPWGQNALRMLVASRPEMAPEVANYLRQLAMPATLGAVPALTNQ